MMRKAAAAGFTPEQLAGIREQLGLSQEALARLLGVSFVSVNRWENGHSGPTGVNMEVYRALDVALRAGMSAEQILNAGTTDPGRVLYWIFHAAYGGQ
jgi:transcriptional regulator with XRE-family HTH domain